MLLVIRHVLLVSGEEWSSTTSFRLPLRHWVGGGIVSVR